MKLIKSIVRVLSGVLFGSLVLLLCFGIYTIVLDGIDIWNRNPMAFVEASGIIAGVSLIVFLLKKIIPWAFKKNEIN